MSREKWYGKLQTHFINPVVGNGKADRPDINEWLYKPVDNCENLQTSVRSDVAQPIVVSPVLFPHTPVQTKEEPPVEFLQVTSLPPTSDILQQAKEKSVHYSVVLCSASTSTVESYVLLPMNMSERGQPSNKLPMVQGCKAQSGTTKDINVMPLSENVSESSNNIIPYPCTVHILNNDNHEQNSPESLCAESSEVDRNAITCSSDQNSDSKQNSTEPLPWDPGELYEYNKSGVSFNGIPTDGTEDVSIRDLNTVAAYVRVVVNGFESLFLLDTGASHTIVSKDFAKFMGMISADTQPDPSITNKGANGSNIGSYGFRSVSLEINGIELKGKALISDVCENGFIGMDLLSKVGAVINFDEMYLQLYEQKVPLLTKDGKRIVNSLFTSRTVYLPKFSQNVVDLRLGEDNCSVGLVEPRLSVLDRYQLVGGRNIGSSSNPKIKLMNPMSYGVVIPAGTSIAYYVSDSVLEMPTKAETESFIHQVSVEQITKDTPIPEHVQCLYEQLPDEISGENRLKIRQMLIKYADVFSKDGDDVGYCDWIKHEIKLLPGTKPIRQPPYRVGFHESKEIEEHVTKLLDKGMIERVVSPWSSPVLTVKKKDGKTRFVQDYRKLNACTEQESYPLPRQDDALEALSGSKYFTTADLTSGYYQIPLSDDAMKISCFVTKSGTYGFKRLPMGLSSSSHCFERLMETVLRGLQYEELLVYMDDVIVFSANQDQHVERLSRMLSRLQDAGLKIKPSKTFLFQKQVEYLGHIVDEHGIHTDPKKVAAINEIVSPSEVKHLRSFLGLTGYYRKFIPNYGGITQPLCRLLKKKVKYEWTDECEQAFAKLKQSLCDNTVLAYPDYSKEFILDTDASYTACGAVLSQLDNEGNERPVAYYSFALKDSQKNYGVTKLEMLALVCAIRHFRTYLYGAKFTCRTDHHSLIWLKNMRQPQGILSRWMETLSHYNFSVIHRPGQLHANADALSRLPNSNSSQPDQLMATNHLSATKQITPDNPDNSNEQTNNETDQDNENTTDCTTFVLDQNQMAEAQKADPDLKRIREWIENDVYPPNKELKKFTRCIRFYLGKRDSLEIKDDLLVEKSTGVSRIAVSHDMQEQVIANFHRDDHAGIERTCKRISTYYIWHMMHSQVRDYIQLCHSCQINKAARNKTRPRSLATGAIMDQISLDIVGSFRPTMKDNTVILVAVEHFSRWAEAYPMTHASAENCAQALYNGIFSRFGFSRIIHMDRAAYFMSDLINELARLGNCKNTFSCRYHPEGNSMVERMNGTLINSLRTTVESSSNREWDELLETVLVAYRATPHPATGLTPNRMMLGRENRLSHVLCPMSDPLPTTEYIRNLDNTLYEAYNKQRNVIAEECHFDGAVHVPFNEGDMVLIQKKKSELNKPGKMESRYYGPFKIIKRLDFDSYVLQENNKEVIEHHSRLKLYRTPNTAVNNAEELPNDQDSSNSPVDPVSPRSSDSFHIPHTQVGAETPNLEHVDVTNRRNRRVPGYLRDYLIDQSIDSD